MMASQLPLTEGKGYDFLPAFKEMTIQLYKVGTMWRFGEPFDFPTGPRDRAFLCLLAMLVADGMTFRKAQKRVAHLNEVSRGNDGQDVLAIAAGYRAMAGDGSLAQVFDRFRDDP